MTQAGQLNKRIELQSETLTADGMGGFTSVWATYMTVWAKKTTHRSNDAIQDMRETGKAIHNYRIHYRTGVRNNHRIKDGDSYMVIIGPPIEIYKGNIIFWLDITTEEVI